MKIRILMNEREFDLTEKICKALVKLGMTRAKAKESERDGYDWEMFIDNRNLYSRNWEV